MLDENGDASRSLIFGQAQGADHLRELRLVDGAHFLPFRQSQSFHFLPRQALADQPGFGAIILNSWVSLWPWNSDFAMFAWYFLMMKYYHRNDLEYSVYIFFGQIFRKIKEIFSKILQFFSEFYEISSF